MSFRQSQTLRWIFLGPLIGVLALSPLAYSLVSQFERAWISDFISVCILVYMLGLPAAAVTGAAHKKLSAARKSWRVKTTLAIAIGGFSSTYFVITLMIVTCVSDACEQNILAQYHLLLLLSMMIGVISTYGVLLIEHLLERHKRSPSPESNQLI